MSTRPNAARSSSNCGVDDFEGLFPAKLHYVLDQAEEDGHGDVVAWQPHGRAFLVKDRKRFVQEFLPNWFRQKKWASFQRQLNHYDFKRMTTDRNAYYHPFFVKGERGLCAHIRRAKCKGTGPRKPSNPEEQPDFYENHSFDAGADRAHAEALSRAVHHGSAAMTHDETPLPLPPPATLPHGSFEPGAPLAAPPVARSLPAPVVRSLPATLIAPPSSSSLSSSLSGLGICPRELQHAGIGCLREFPDPIPWPLRLLVSSSASLSSSSTSSMSTASSTYGNGAMTGPAGWFPSAYSSLPHRPLSAHVDAARGTAREGDQAPRLPPTKGYGGALLPQVRRSTSDASSWRLTPNVPGHSTGP